MRMLELLDRLASALLDLDIAHRFGRDAFAHGADVEFAGGIFEITGGLLDCSVSSAVLTSSMVSCSGLSLLLSTQTRRLRCS